MGAIHLITNSLCKNFFTYIPKHNLYLGAVVVAQLLPQAPEISGPIPSLRGIFIVEFVLIKIIENYPSLVLAALGCHLIADLSQKYFKIVA